MHYQEILDLKKTCTNASVTLKLVSGQLQLFFWFFLLCCKCIADRRLIKESHNLIQQILQQLNLKYIS